MTLVAGVGVLLVGMFAVGPTSAPPPEESASMSTSTAETLTVSTSSPNPIVPNDDRDVSVPSESLEALATSTSEIAVNSSKVAQSTDNIDQNTKQMVGALEELRDTFRAAVRSGTIVAEPKSVGEFYHNAQAYQIQGKLADAQKMYLSVFDHGGDFVDVHRQFQSLLISQHDEGEIRKIYDSLPGDNANLVRQYALALTEADLDAREQRLRDLLVDDANFAPAAYELSRICSADVLGRQGLSDKRNERRWLKVFRALTRDGHLTEYFLDPTKATELTAEADQRWVAVRDIDESVFNSPVAANLMAARGATTIMISIGEPTLEIRYRIDQTGEFKSTGHLPYSIQLLVGMHRKLW